MRLSYRREVIEFKNAASNRVCIVIPTYNEKENIGPLVSAIQSVLKGIRMDRSTTLLIVDDNSPDGTGELAEEMAKTYGNVGVLHRSGKLGLGSAYKEGFSHAIRQLSCDVVFQMDADFSHDPKFIPSILEGIREGYDVVVGSRRIEGGGVVGWSIYRKMVSWVGNKMAQLLVGIKVHDSTSGYRAFNRHTLQRVDYSTMKSGGYAFQVEMLFRCQKEGARVGEKPIVFVDRGAGKSKLGVKEWIEFTRICVKLLMSRLRLWA